MTAEIVTDAARGNGPEGADGECAAAAGIEANDLIVKADGERVTTVKELQSAIRSHEIGETVEITVYRIPNLTQIKANEDIPDGEYLTFDVEVKVIK